MNSEREIKRGMAAERKAFKRTMTVKSSHEKALSKKGRTVTTKERAKNPYLSADSKVYPRKK